MSVGLKVDRQLGSTQIFDLTKVQDDQDARTSIEEF